MGMSISNGTRLLFVSDCLNMPTCTNASDIGIGAQCGTLPLRESWAAFMARWWLWHLVSLSIVSYKVRTYPKELRWLALLNLLSLWSCIWTGYQQDKAHWPSLNQTVQSYSHYVASVVVFVTFFTETITLWEPTRLMGAVYGGVVALYLLLFVIAMTGAIPDTGIPYIKQHIEIPLEYVVLALHLVVCWKKHPTFANSKWRPWLCCNDCCLCCCKGLDRHWANQAV